MKWDGIKKLETVPDILQLIKSKPHLSFLQDLQP